MTRKGFWPRVQKCCSSCCWLWQGPVNRKGYGYISLKTYGESLAHRFAWREANGPIPDGLCVLHRCDTPACVNPNHLFLGTLIDNNADMRAKNRHAVGEKNALSKLTRQTVEAIRSAAGLQREIAARFQVHQATVSRIKAGRVWASERA